MKTIKIPMVADTIIFSFVVYRNIIKITVRKSQLIFPVEPKNLHFQKLMTDILKKSLQSYRLCKVLEKPLTEYHFCQDSYNAKSNIEHINIFGGS